MIVQRNVRNGERGQVLLLCAFSMVVLLLFVGMAIDFGLAYVTKARLSKAVDAAALTGARYVGLGTTQAKQIAQTSFYMNYVPTSRDVSGTPPVEGTISAPQVDFNFDPALNVTKVKVTANATINSYFLGFLPAFKSLNVSSTAEARYARAQMTLVIDRTGSMKNNAPGTELADAIKLFVNDFDNTNDTVALVSFANDQTVDVPMMTGGFQTPMTNAANGMRARFNGGTFSDGALQLALTEELKDMGLKGNIIHAVVFFTDGQANTIQNSLICTGTALRSGTWNFGGTDTHGYVNFNSTDNKDYKNQICPGKNNTVIAYPLNSNPPNNSSCDSQSDGSTNVCNGTFPSTVTGKMMSLTWANVNADALNRSILDANAMRANNIIVYSIGLGASPQASFLCQIANDPCKDYGGNPAYNPNLPVGEYRPAADASQLAAAFQQIADNIHLRLLQ